MIAIDTILIKPVSRCNIDCTYCYVYHMGDMGWLTMPKVMSSETITATASALQALARAQSRRFAVVFHGGEPLLLGAAKLDVLLTALRQVLPSPEYPFSIQTNGTLITDEILDICSTHHTSLGISIDGPPAIHNRHRIDHRGQGTFNRVLNGIAKLRQHPDASFLYAGLLAVIDPDSDAQEVYDIFKEIGAESLDFLYRDGNHSHLPYGKSSIQSTEYGGWLANLVDVYLNDPEPFAIRLLDDLIKLILGGNGMKEGLGNNTFGILIIDTDGSVKKNDTLKSTFQNADCFDAPWSVHTHHLVDIVASPEFAHYSSLQRPTASSCLACPELDICGGGMLVNRWRNSNGYDNPSVYCADQLHLIRYIRNRINTLLTTCAT